MGNGVFLKTILNQFLKQFPGEMEELRTVVKSRNKKKIAQLSHHIQSTVSVLGRNSPFFKQLEYLEHMANNKSTPEEISAEHAKLEELNQLLMQDINQLKETDF
jgi:flagellar biosynthesis/type III secretory pathway chaperone